MRRTTRAVLTILVFCVSFLASLILVEELTHIALTIELDDKEQKKDALQIFWRNEDTAFSEKNSKVFEINYAHYTFSLDLGNLVNFPAIFRVDPTFGPGHVHIIRVCFNTFLPIYCISSEDDFKLAIVNVTNIDDIQYNKKGILVKTQQGDPYIEMFIPPQVSQRVLALEILSAVLFSSGVTMGFRTLYAWVFDSRRRRGSRESYTNHIKGQQG